MGDEAVKPTFALATSPADFREIDELAAAVPLSSPFQTGLMARIYAASPDARPLALVARNEHGSPIASLVAVTFSHGRSPRSLTSRLSLHSTIRGSPLVVAGEGELVLASMIRGLVPYLPVGTLYVRCYPDRESRVLHVLSEHGYARENWTNIFLDLSLSEERLQRGMSKHRRKGIRSAEHAGVTVQEGANDSDLDATFSILKASHERLHIPLQRRELFQAVRRDLVPQKHAVFLLARHRDAVVAARVILVWGEVAYDWYAGSDQSSRAVHADEFLTWTAILRAQALGATVYDFGGTGLPSEQYGPREFKRRFGGVETNLGRYTRILRPSRLRAVKLAARSLGLS